MKFLSIISFSLLLLIGCSKTPIVPIAGFNYSGANVAPATITFVNNSTNATSYSWDFGDGTTSAELNPMHTYSTAGSYTVTLTAKNEDGVSTTSKTIKIEASAPIIPMPVSSFTITGGKVAPTSITFTSTSTNADTYAWSFGDGGTSTLANPSHTYSAAGVYNISLTVTNAKGSHTSSQSLTITAPVVYNNLSINKVSITNLDWLDGAGAGWDATDGPDLYFELCDAAGTVLITSKTTRVDNVVAAMLPVAWTLASNVTNLNTVFIIKVWDYDAIGNDLIGSKSFKFVDYKNGYPANINIPMGTNTNVQFTVSWY